LRRSTVLRNLIPAVIVALVLGSSFVISGFAKDRGGEGGGDHNKCGYGYQQQDNDENGGHDDDNQQQGNNNDASTANAKAKDNDKCEDEDTGEGDAEGGGDHGDSHIDQDHNRTERGG
jgi:hypothetical protein